MKIMFYNFKIIVFFSNKGTTVILNYFCSRHFSIKDRQFSIKDGSIEDSEIYHNSGFFQFKIVMISLIQKYRFRKEFQNDFDILN